MHTRIDICHVFKLLWQIISGDYLLPGHHEPNLIGYLSHQILVAFLTHQAHITFKLPLKEKAFLS
jgi:hypothetical protein